MTDRLCLLTVHAHPDDESSKGAGTVAKYKSEGVHCVLVCCTGGELGDIVNPAMESPEVRENLGAVRREELDRATKLIGFDEVVMLGYRDSGMVGSPGNYDLRSFHQAPLDEAVGRLVAIIRRVRPHVLMTYGDEQQGYPHPDHLKVHAISGPAFELAGDQDAFPWAGPPWQPQKLYYSAWSRQRFLKMHERMLELGIESPFDSKWFDRPSVDERLTTQIEIGDFYDVRIEALLAHATQIDPTSKFWFGLPHDEARKVHPWEEFIRVKSLVDGGDSESSERSAIDSELALEADLFHGLR